VTLSILRHYISFVGKYGVVNEFQANFKLWYFRISRDYNILIIKSNISQFWLLIEMTSYIIFCIKRRNISLSAVG